MVLMVFLENMIHDAITFIEQNKRRTVTVMDVMYKKQGRSLYSFSGSSDSRGGGG